MRKKKKDKTICIPLWPEGVEEIRARIDTQVPQWSQLHIDSKGTYLGFVVGPGRGESSWEKPLAKYKKRVASWSRVGGGMQYATLAYNVFALSTLLYVGQLECIPRDVLEQERLHVCRMFPGPGK